MKGTCTSTPLTWTCPKFRDFCRHAAPSQCCAEVSAARVCTRPTRTGAFSTRSSGRLGLESSQYLHDLRHWRAGRTSLYCHGAPGRHDAEASDRWTSDGDGNSHVTCNRDWRRTGRSPRERHRSSRYQTGEYLRDKPGKRKGFGFWFGKSFRVWNRGPTLP